MYEYTPKFGNLNRCMLTKKNDMTRKVCYGINEIARNSQTQFISQKQSEQAYKRLMTSISHDIKTPLASLVGYLEAFRFEVLNLNEVSLNIIADWQRQIEN